MKTKFLKGHILLLMITMATTGWTQKYPGQIIWQETFNAEQWSNSVVNDTTIIENLPAGWIFTDSTGNQFYWQWSQQGPRGRFTSPNGGLVPKNQLTPAAAIASATAAGGFLLMPSDWYNTAENGQSVTPAVTMNATIQYGPVDLSAHPVVHFRMEYFFRLLKPANASVTLSFFTLDGKANYIVEIPYAENIPSANAQLLDIDLTNTPVAGQAGVYFSLNQRGSSRYFFMIDDIAFYQPVNRDIRIANQWIDYVVNGPVSGVADYDMAYFGAYKHIPIGLGDFFKQTRTDVFNFGGIDRQNLRVRQTIENLDLTPLNPVLETQSGSFSLTIGQRDTVVTSLNFRPLQLGRYKLTTVVTDGSPEDFQYNTSEEFFTVTQSLYSHIDTAQSAGLQYIEADSSSLAYGYGQLFWVPNLEGNTTTFTHAGFKIHQQQSPNALNNDTIKIQVRAMLFRKSGNVFELVQQSEAYEPQASDIGKNVVLPFVNPQALDGNRDYYLVFNVLNQIQNQTFNRRLRFAYDPSHKTSFGRSSILLSKDNSVASLQNTFAFFVLTSGGYVPQETNILSFTIPNQVGNTEINQQAKTVTVKMLPGTDLTQLVPEFILSYGAQAFINDIQQTSGVSQVNLAQPVVYKIINGTDTTHWTVTVDYVEFQANIVSFTIPDQTSQTQINPQEQTVLVSMPYSADLSALVPTFVLSPGAKAYVNDVEQISGVTANDFTTPVVYVVRNLGDVEKSWTVTVTKPSTPSTGADILTFGFSGQTQPSIINTEQASVRVNLPSSANLERLVPLFTLSPGAKAYHGSNLLVSGGSIVNFTTPQTIRVVAENGVNERLWTVTVTNNQSEQADFLALSVNIDMNGDTVPDTTFHAIVYPANKRMELHLPNYVPIDSIVPYFSVSSGAHVFLGEGETEFEIISGVTKLKLQPQLAFKVKSQSEGTKLINQWILYTYRSIVSIETTMGQENTVKIYPNPSTTQLFCEVDEDMRNGNYSLINLSGQVVKVGNYRGISFGIDVASLPTGVYFLTIESHRNRVIEKIIIH